MYPKQFQRFNMDGTLFQATARRVASPDMYAPLVVCNHEHRFIAAEQLSEAGVEPADIILEPVGRNTASAILTAALWAEENAPDRHLLVLPSDHIVRNNSSFAGMVAHAMDALPAGRIATFGVRASSQNPDMGYIRPAEDDAGVSGLRNVERFREKPDADTLAAMSADTSWLWNTGMILAAPATILEKTAAIAPEIVANVRTAYVEAARDLDFCRLAEQPFSAIEPISFDRLVLERLEDLMVLPADLEWLDASNWQTIWQAGARDGSGNLAIGDTILEDTTNSLVMSEDTLTATLGIDNIAVVVTDDSVLVADMNNAKDMSRIVKRVADKGGEKHLFHSRVYRPWGSFRGLAVGDRFQVKEIVVKPGASLSLQKHFHRAEHWIVVEGTAKVRCGDDEFLLKENQSTYIPLGAVHRLENPGKIPIRLIEVQSGSYVGEDDIVRLEDTYGRN